MDPAPDQDPDPDPVFGEFLASVRGGAPEARAHFSVLFDVEALRLALVVANSKTLVELDLSKCGFSAEGARLLAVAIAKNTSIRRLVLGPTSPRVHKVFSWAIRESPSVQTVDWVFT